MVEFWLIKFGSLRAIVSHSSFLKHCIDVSLDSGNKIRDAELNAVGLGSPNAEVQFSYQRHLSAVLNATQCREGAHMGAHSNPCVNCAANIRATGFSRRVLVTSQVNN